MTTIPNNGHQVRRTWKRTAVLVLLLSRPAATYGQVSLAHDPKPSEDPRTASQVTDPPDGMDQETTRLQVQGFGDIRFRATNETGVSSTFSIGQLDLFITSPLAGDLAVLSEVVFEADDDNHYSVDIERLLLQFSPSDFLNIGFGRYHTGIGFYNNAYHHGEWFQTALGRPRLFEFEDDEGILPVHGVGITARGRIPSGRLGLRWLAEVGNGRRYLGTEAVQVIQDDNSFKAVNVGFLLRPEWVPGLQTGLSVYRDRPTSGSGRVDESIIAAHVVYQSGMFEQLNEVVFVRHTLTGEARTSNTTGIYTQLSRRYGRLSPYFRYEYLDVPEDDPLIATIGRVSGPSLGMRYDFRDLAALKIQWNRVTRGGGITEPVNGIAAQVAFRF